MYMNISIGCGLNEIVGTKDITKGRVHGVNCYKSIENEVD